MSWAEAKHIEDYLGDKIDGFKDILDPNPVYGFIEHMATLSPSQRIEYIGANKNYTPFSLNTGTGAMDLGSWANFPLILSNKPCMVKSDGTKDYELDPNDYTKKAADGTPSDVANTSYNGGAFAWLQRIYKNEYVIGTDRYVLFCMTKKNESFKPVGFVDNNNGVLEGVWLPMFYGVKVGTKLTSFASGYPEKNQQTSDQKTAIDNFSSRARFFGGPIVETIVDLLMMWAKTSDLQSAYGNGNSNGYDSTDTTNYGMKANAVVGGGAFYGTATQKSLNKILHSLVLGTYNQWQRDPYEVVVNGVVKVSKNYAYDVTGAAYQGTGAFAHNADGGKWNYPHMFVSVPDYGSVPVAPYNGSTATGACDGVYIDATQESMTGVCLRFGACDGGSLAGVRARSWNNVASYTHWGLGASLLLLPPVGAAA